MLPDSAGAFQPVLIPYHAYDSIDPGETTTVPSIIKCSIPLEKALIT